MSTALAQSASTKNRFQDMKTVILIGFSQFILPTVYGIKRLIGATAHQTKAAESGHQEQECGRGRYGRQEHA